MKALFTLILVLIFGATALAHNTPADVKVEVSQMGIVLDSSIDAPVFTDEITPAKENAVTRLYRFKNSRVKKALSFSTKRNKAKLA
ncbi:MAG: hypothetical protein AB3N14_01945 [Flavobacteriaceae bacterium]